TTDRYSGGGAHDWEGPPFVWCADGLGHTVEDHDTLTAAARRCRFVGAREAAVDVLPVIDRPDVSCRIDRNIGLHLQTAAYIAAGWRNLIAGLEAGRTVLGAHPAQLHDRARWHREVGDPDIVVTVHNNSPWPGQSAARERRAGIFAAVRPQERHAPSVHTAALLGHGPYKVLVVVGDPHDPLKLFQSGLSPFGAAEPVRDPDVTFT